MFHLIISGRIKDARKGLFWLYGGNNNKQLMVDAEIETVRTSLLGIEQQ